MTNQDELNDWIKVEIPIRWLVTLWHFWNDGSASDAFFKQYKLHDVPYRNEAKKVLEADQQEEWRNVHWILYSAGIHPCEITLREDKLTVPLNPQHIATIDKHGVHVNCQTFSFERVNELNKAIKKFKKRKKS